jgi:Winged helix DNA-binding domain
VAEPVLTERALNRALLARQLLVDRAGLAIPDALERIGGIQNQYAPNAYLRLWSCLTDFRRDDLTRAYERGSVVQATLMRGTIHTVSAADYHPMLAGIAPTQRTWADRATRAPARTDVRRHVERVRAALRGTTMRRPELMALLADEHQTVRQSIDTDAEILRVPPSGTWERRRADVCALADDVIGHVDVDEATGMAHLVRRYLAGFGPAAVADIASFAGMNAGPVKALVATLGLRRFRDEAGGMLLDVPDAPLPDPATEVPVRFLPTWDAILLVHARRTGVLPEAYRPLVFHTKMPPSYPTFLVDGQVAGTWRHTDAGVELAPFRTITAAEQRAVDDEAHRLEAFHRA